MSSHSLCDLVMHIPIPMHITIPHAFLATCWTYDTGQGNASGHLGAPATSACCFSTQLRQGASRLVRNQYPPVTPGHWSDLHSTLGPSRALRRPGLPKMSCPACSKPAEGGEHQWQGGAQRAVLPSSRGLGAVRRTHSAGGGGPAEACPHCGPILPGKPPLDTLA